MIESFSPDAILESMEPKGAPVILSCFKCGVLYQGPKDSEKFQKAIKAHVEKFGNKHGGLSEVHVVSTPPDA